MTARARFLAAVHRQPVDRPPVWLMRQAGRYLPEYRELRARHDFWTLLRTPALAAEVTLQPIRRFGMDAAILFSDILVVPDALGVPVEYAATGPRMGFLVRTPADLARVDATRLTDRFGYVAEATSTLVETLHPDHAVIGFAGAPFTLAAYLVEDGPDRALANLLAMARRDRPLYDDLLLRLTDAVVALLEVQIDAGADMVQLFDTWSGRLDRDQYRDLALPWAKRVFDQIAGRGVPMALYIRGAATNLEEALTAGCSVLSVDSPLPIDEARRRLPASIALQGNFDPARLHGPRAAIREAVGEMIEAAGTTGYIVNLGSGLTPETPVAGVSAFVGAVKERRA